MSGYPAKTALDHLGMTQKEFAAMAEESPRRLIDGLCDALAIIAKGQHSDRIWENIGITQRAYNKLEGHHQARLTNTWLRLKDPKKFAEMDQAAEISANETERKRVIASMGLTEEQFIAMPEGEKATIIAAFAAAKGQKEAAKAESHAKLVRGCAFAAALGITGLFAALASTEFAPKTPRCNMNCTADDTDCLDRLERIMIEYAPK